MFTQCEALKHRTCLTLTYLFGNTLNAIEGRGSAEGTKGLQVVVGELA